MWIHIYLLFKLNSFEVIVFTVLAFSQQILKQGLKIRSFSKSTFAGLLTNVLTFNPRWLEGLFLIFKNGHISASRAKIETLRALSFLQLLKFEKYKYLYFFDCRPFAWDMAVFWFKQVLYLNAANHSLTLSTPYKKNPHSPQKWLKCTWNLYKYWECVNMFYLEANVISRLAEGQS